MAENRFKKSVDRATANTLNNILDNTLDNTLDNIKDNILPNTKDNILSNISSNILENVVSKEKKSRGSNHTFYLSQEVGESLTKLSKKTKQSKSTIVNDVLKAVLIENKT